MNTLDITAATKKDIPDITKILNDATKYKLKLGDTSWGSDEWKAEEIEASMQNGTFYLAQKGNELVGIFLLKWSDTRNWGKASDAGGYVHRLAVANEYRGQGIGEQLLEYAQKLVKEKGRSYLRLDCDKNNKNLCAYYEKQGFKLIAVNDIPSKKVDRYVAALHEKRV